MHRNGLEEGAILAEIQFPIGTPESEVQVDAAILSDVTFEKGFVTMGQRGILSHLDDIISRVKNVIAGFESLIDANPNWLLIF